MSTDDPQRLVDLVAETMAREALRSSIRRSARRLAPSDTGRPNAVRWPATKR